MANKGLEVGAWAVRNMLLWNRRGTLLESQTFSLSMLGWKRVRKVGNYGPILVGCRKR